MDVQVWMASKEVADRLDVHVRTLRNWLDLFVPAHERLKNPQGHYLISENGFALLKEVKERKDSGNSSLREIQRQLIDEGRIPEDLLLSDELSSVEETAITVAASNKLDAGMQEMERSVQETLVQFQRDSRNYYVDTMQSTILYHYWIEECRSLDR